MSFDAEAALQFFDSKWHSLEQPTVLTGTTVDAKSNFKHLLAHALGIETPKKPKNRARAEKQAKKRQDEQFLNQSSQKQENRELELPEGLNYAILATAGAGLLLVPQTKQQDSRIRRYTELFQRKLDRSARLAANLESVLRTFKGTTYGYDLVNALKPMLPLRLQGENVRGNIESPTREALFQVIECNRFLVIQTCNRPSDIESMDNGMVLVRHMAQMYLLSKEK